MVVLDTDHLSLLQRLESPEGQRLRQRLQPLPPQERTVTIVSFEEQSRGWLKFLAKAKTPASLLVAFANLKRHLENYCSLHVLDFDDQAAVRYDQLMRSRLRIGAKDLQIAAIDLAHDATLLSRNVKDFGKVPGLKVEDWTT